MQGGGTEAGTPGDLLHGRVGSLFGDRDTRRGKQLLVVALGIGAINRESLPVNRIRGFRSRR